MAKTWHYAIIMLPWPNWNDAPMRAKEAEGWDFVSMSLCLDDVGSSRIAVLYKKKLEDN